MQKTAKAIIDQDINPFVDEWEASGQYPAKQVFKKLAEAGLLGVNKPVEYGGMGLNFKFSIALKNSGPHQMWGRTHVYRGADRHGPPRPCQIRLRV